MQTLDVENPGLPDLQFVLMVLALCTSDLPTLNAPEAVRQTVFHRCWALIHEGPPPERKAALLDAALAALPQNEPYLEAALLVERLEPGVENDVSEQAAARAKELALSHGYADVAARLTLHEAQRAVGEGRYEEAHAVFLVGHLPRSLP